LNACAPLPTVATVPASTNPTTAQTHYRWLNRTTWGATSSATQELDRLGSPQWLQLQLQPKEAALPEPARDTVRAMTISKTNLMDLVLKMEQQRKDSDAIKDDAEKKTAQQAYQNELTRLSREAATRHLLRALYSPAQVQ
jgi:hypothetical protein